MNFKTTIALLALLIAVGVALLIVNKRQSSDSTTPTEKKLFDIDSKDITRVAVTPADGKPFVLEKKNDAWRLVEPVNAPAETWAVDALAGGISGLKARTTVDSLEGTGLDKPRYVIEFQAKGKTSKLKIGNRSSIGDNLYVQPEGDSNVTVVPADLLEQLDKPVSAFRQSRLVSAGSAEIKQIAITRPDEPKIVLQKNGADWQVVEPERMPAESTDASDIASAISFLTAAEFVNNEADVKPPQLLPSHNPQMTVWFSTALPTTQPATTQPAGTTIKFGGFDSIAKKNVYVSVSDPATLAKVAASSMDAFKKKPIELRDRKVVEVDPANVSRISIITDKPSTTQPTTRPASHNELVIERKKESQVVKVQSPTTRPTTQPVAAATTQPTTQPALPATVWALKSGTPGDASQSKVEALLAKFHPLKADKYVEATAAATQPSATYTIEITSVSPGAAQTTTHQIRLLDRGDDKPLIGQYNKLVFEVPRTLVEGFGDDYTNKPEVKEPQPPAMPPGMPMGMPMMGQ